MGLMDVLNGMQSGPRGPRAPSTAGSGGGMSPMMMAMLGLLAYKALKSFTSGPSASTAAPADRRRSRTRVATRPGFPADWVASPAVSVTSSKVPWAAYSAGGAAGSVLSGGLSDLLKQLQQSGQGNTAQSWVGKGPNQQISSNDLAKALGADQISALMSHTGLSREDLLAGLSQNLPDVVDQLTPDGRVPAEHELSL